MDPAFNKRPFRSHIPQINIETSPSLQYNKWYHLDLTWDDPVMSDGTERLSHDYMLIDTNRLLELEKSQHNFDQNVFLEVK